jgi:outer membrane protein OmpA-like peptidoglycan-associated protein
MASPVYELGVSVEVLDPIFFRHMSSVPMGYLAPVASAAKSAKNVLLVGHSSLFASEVLSKPSISLRRANAVKQALTAKRVRSEIIAVSVSYGSPVSLKLSESAQASNRRVMVYLFS